MKKLIILFLLSISINANAKPEWETVTNGWAEISCYRLEVPGGWFVATRISSGTAIVFYPDTKHEWKI